MKTRLFMVLGIMSLVLVFGELTRAVDLPEEGAFIFKTWNYEVGTNYWGGEKGKIYLRTAGTSYNTIEHGLIDNTNPNYGGVIADELIIDRDPSLKEGEDTWGLLRITQIYEGDVTANDSHFGDGSNGSLLGNDITAAAGPAHWRTGDEIKNHETYLRGMLWGNQDQVVECVSPGSYGPDMIPFTDDDVIGYYKIWSANAQYRVFEILDDPAYNPAVDPAHSPAARDVVTPGAEDDFDGWFNENIDKLMAAGHVAYYRYKGQLPVTAAFAGTTEVVFDVEEGTWSEQLIMDWWTHPEPDGTGHDVWQSWNIGNPFVFANGWTGSEDSARGYVSEPQVDCLLEVDKEGCVVVPEPGCVTELPAGPGPYDVIYTYDVTNIGADPVENVSVIDDQIGEVPGSPIASLAPGETVTLSATVSLSEETTNTVTVTGYSGGEECQASDTVTITKKEEEGCRMTGGGNDTFTADGIGPLNNKLAKGKSNENGSYYTFGGQAGAPMGCQPQPWGNWTHTHHSGMKASFTFHAGTASAPEDTEIDWIACSDPGWCVQARPAPNKQIDFGGTGTFKNIRLKNNSPLKWMEKDKLFDFEVHVEDLGEPGKGGKVDPPAPTCPPEGSAGALADCECPDFYRIIIYNRHGSDIYGPEQYEVFGYIKGGNLQIHPPLKCK